MTTTLFQPNIVTENKQEEERVLKLLDKLQPYTTDTLIIKPKLEKIKK